MVFATEDMQTSGLRRGPSLLAAIMVTVCLAVILFGVIYASASEVVFGEWTVWVAVGAGIIGLFGLLGYLTLREQARATQIVSEPTYLEAFRLSPDPVLITREGVPVVANDLYMDLAERVGVLGESRMPPTLDRVFAGVSSQDASASIYRLLSVSVGSETLRVLDEEGTLRAYQVDVTDLGPGSGNAKMWRIRDLTGPEPLAGTLSEAPVGLMSFATDGSVTAVNATLSRWLGLPEGARPPHIAAVVQAADALLDTPREVGAVHRFDTHLVTSHNVVTPVVAVLSWLELEDGNPIGSLAVYGHSNVGTDIARSRAQAAAPTDGQPGDTFNSAPFAIVELDSNVLSEAKITQGNPAYQRLTGRDGGGESFADLFSGDVPEFIGLSGEECDPDEPYSASLKSADGGMPVNVYLVCHPRREDRCWAYIVDVSQRAQLQEQLMQSQKMQAIGQLAAGVAHDFNNLLQAIRLNTDELLGRHPVGDPSYLELQRVNSDVMRAAALVKKLLAFSRKQTLQAEVLDVTETLSDVSVTLRQTLSERVRLDIQHGRDLPVISADRSQLETVLINLCVNARDAMLDDKGKGGGTITIASRSVTAEGLGLKAPYGNRAVLIEVSDTGSGMDEETMAKIFEPFFTTKEQGKGTGLGLATVYGIVEQSGGHLDVQSVLGEGTTFRIFLPAADPDKVVELAPEKATAVKAPANLSGQGTILLVEDEESVRTIAAKTLRKRGYRVIEAGDGEEALEWLEEDAEPVDLLLSDVVMPGMDGPTLLREGRELLGEARIVFMSGYAKSDFSDLLAEQPDVTFLPKPFTLAQLAEKVKSEIGEAKAA